MIDSNSTVRDRKSSSKLDPNWRIQWGLSPKFPLFPHQSGRWAKKVRGQLHYFGKIATDPNGSAAWKLFGEQEEDLKAGRKPRANTGELTVYELTQRFLTSKLGLLEAGEIVKRTHLEYEATCETIDKHFGSKRIVADIRPDEFKALRKLFARKWGPVRVGNEIQRVRSVFKYAVDADLIDKAVRFGPDFEKPSAKVMRQNRAQKGPQLFTPQQIKALVKAAEPPMAAMILLAINGGLGNTDLALLTADKFDLAGGWLDYPRIKTGMPRRIPLWPETVAAVKLAIEKRRQPADPADAKLLFIGARGSSYVNETGGHRVAQEFADLRKNIGIEDRVFYDLRRTFETIADNKSRDGDGVRAIMGHAPKSGDMSAIYRQQFDDDRLRSIVNHVRDWLYADDGGKNV